jgi:hypothetical protein
MLTRILIFLIFFIGQPAFASKCYGEDPCFACHTCEYCKHCNSGGNPCGVLKAERGLTNSAAKPVHSAAQVVHPKPQNSEIEIWGPGVKKGEWFFGPDNHIHQRKKAPAQVAPPVAPKIKSYVQPSPTELPAMSDFGSAFVSPPMARTENNSLQAPIQQPSQPVIPPTWKLQIIPFMVNGSNPSIVGFHWIADTQPSSKVDAWNAWGERFLHLVYQELAVQPGIVSNNFSCLFEIFVRADGKLLLKELGSTGSQNIRSLEVAVLSLSGRPELAFPCPLHDDTIYISGQLAYAPDQATADVWGRVQQRPNTIFNRFVW